MWAVGQLQSVDNLTFSFVFAKTSAKILLSRKRQPAEPYPPTPYTHMEISLTCVCGGAGVCSTVVLAYACLLVCRLVHGFVYACMWMCVEKYVCVDLSKKKDVCTRVYHEHHFTRSRLRSRNSVTGPDGVSYVIS